MRGWFGAWFAALQHAFRSAVRVDRSQLTIATALRSTIGFALPLVVGLATGHLLEGVAVAGGAAGVGAVGLTYTYRVRTRTMLLASLGVAVSACVGGVTGHIDWLAILVVGVWGVGAGFLVAISQRAMIIGLQSTIALIILAHFSASPEQALVQSGLMFAGALLQTFLAFLPSPWVRFGPETAALSTVYQVLADSVEYSTDSDVGQQVREAFVNAGEVLADNKPRSRKGKIFYGLLEGADHIHLELIVLSRLQQSLLAEEQKQDDSSQQLELVLKAAITALRGIGATLYETATTAQFTQAFQEIELAIARLQQQAMGEHAGDTVAQILLYCNAFREQLRIVEAIATSWRDKRDMSFPVNTPEQPGLRLRDPLAILRANFTLRSTACRHAIRLGVILALATLLYRIFPIQRGYWIPLTALLVLKPDFTTTFARGTARSMGTILGAVLTTALVALLMPTNTTLVILDALAAFIAFSFLNLNYAIFSSFVTVEVVLLLTFVDPHPFANTFDRALDTVIGGAMALLAYTLWPTWERSQVPKNIAQRIEALQHYFVAVMKAYIHPATYNAQTMQLLRQEARLARTNAAASVERSLKEPASYQLHPDTSRGLIAATDGLAKSILALDANLLDTPEVQPLPLVASFSDEVAETLTALKAEVQGQGGEGAVQLEKVQEAMRQLENGASGDGEADLEVQLVAVEAHHIVHGLNAMGQLLRGRGSSVNGKATVHSG